MTTRERIDRAVVAIMTNSKRTPGHSDRDAIVEIVDELDAAIARLTRERDEARAVAADKREGLGLVGLVEWLQGASNVGCFCTDSRSSDPNRVHDHDCQAGEWARRIAAGLRRANAAGEPVEFS